MTHLADLQPEHRSVGQFSMASGRTYVSRSKGKVAATSLADLKLGLQSSSESKTSLADLPVKNAAEKERLQQQHVAKFDKWFFCLR